MKDGGQAAFMPTGVVFSANNAFNEISAFSAFSANNAFNEISAFSAFSAINEINEISASALS